MKENHIMTDQKTPATAGVHHVGITVPNVNETAAFFETVLGFNRVAEREDYPAIFVSDGTVMITIWQVQDASQATQFDRKNVVGLHHLALKIDNAKLDDLSDTLSARDDVTIEFTPQSAGGGKARHMMFAIPGGVRMELIAAVTA